MVRQVYNRHILGANATDAVTAVTVIFNVLMPMVISILEEPMDGPLGLTGKLALFVEDQLTDSSDNLVECAILLNEFVTHIGSKGEPSASADPGRKQGCALVTLFLFVSAFSLTTAWFLAQSPSRKFLSPENQL